MKEFRKTRSPSIQVSPRRGNLDLDTEHLDSQEPDKRKISENMEILSRIIQVSLASEVELHDLTDSVTDTLPPNIAVQTAGFSDPVSPVYSHSRNEGREQRPVVEQAGYRKIQRFVPSRAGRRFRPSVTVAP